MFKEPFNPTLRKSNNYAYVAAFVYLGSLSTLLMSFCLLDSLVTSGNVLSKNSVQEGLPLAQSMPDLSITSPLLIHFFFYVIGQL